MNPYVHLGKSQSPAAEGQPQSGADSASAGLGSWIKSVFNSALSPATAFALVLFAATAVAGMALVAYTEMSSTEVSPLAYLFSHKAHAQVLGTASYGYNQPVCGKYICMNYQLADQNADGYNARIDYWGVSGPAVGSIRVNGYRFQYYIRGNGTTYTGYNLDPGETYAFRFYSGYTGRGKLLDTLTFTTPDSGGSTCPPQQTPPPGCYYDNSDSCGGNLVCAPSYGYTTLDYSSGPGTFVQGWIENLIGTNYVAPGVVTLNGWAYDNGKTPALAIALLNTDTGQQYQPTGTTMGGLYRNDISGYIAQKLGSQPTFMAGMFSVTFTNLPAGHYQVYDARFDGYLFNVFSQAMQNITIANQPLPPSYGYSLPGNGAPTGQATEGWIESYFTNGSTNAIGINGWAYDNGKPLNIQISLQNATTGSTYVISAIPSSSRSDVNTYLTGKFGSGIPWANTSFTGQVTGLPNGTYNVISAKFNGYNFYVEGQAQWPYYLNTGSSGASGLTVSLTGQGMLTVYPGQVSQSVANFAIYNFGNNAVTINSVNIQVANSGISGNFQNLRLYQGTLSIGNTQAVVVNGNIYTFSSPIVLPARTTTYLNLGADVTPNASFGSQNLFTLQALNAVDQTTGAGISSNAPVAGQIVSLNTSAITIRVGTNVNVNGTVFLVGSKGLYGYPDVATFNSWGYSFTAVVPANSAEMALPQLGVVPMKLSGCNSPLDQIAGTCGSNTPPGAVSVIPNGGALTIVPGGVSQKVASFAINAGSSSLNVTSVTLQAVGVNSGTYFQNLKILVNGTQFGQSYNSLAINSTYTFSQMSQTPFMVPANSKVVVDVYEDVSASANFSTSSLIYFYGLKGTLITSGQSILAISPVAGQGVTTSSQITPYISGTLDPTSPASTTFPAGSTNVAVAAYRFGAVGSDITIDSLNVFTTSANCNFTNLMLIDAATGQQVGQTVAATAASTSSTGSSCQANFLNLNYKIPNANLRTLTLKLSIPASVPAGTTFLFSAGVSGSSALGTVTLSGAIAGNTMTVASVISPSLASLGVSPVTLSGTINAGAAGVTIAQYNLTASNNNAFIKSVTFTLGGTANPASSLANLRLFIGASQVGAIQSASNKVTFDLSSMPWTVPVNTTAVMKLQADVVGGAGQTLTAAIQSGSDLSAVDLVYNTGISPNGMFPSQSGSFSLVANTNPSPLNVTLDPFTPPSGSTNAGSVNLEVLRIKFAAGSSNVTVNSVTMGTSYACNFMNLFLFDPATGSQVGSLVPVATYAGTQCQAAFNNLNFAVAANSSRSLALELSLPVSASAGNFSFSMLSSGAVAVNSSATLNSPVINGNSLTINPISSNTGNPFVTGIILIPSSVTFNSANTYSYTSTILGNNLTSSTYFDLLYQGPSASTVQNTANNWQQDSTFTQVNTSGTRGTFILLGLRAHNNVTDHSGSFMPVSAVLTVN